jgi:hypothetical protein
VFGVWFLVSGVVLWCHVRVRLPGELNVRHELIVNLPAGRESKIKKCCCAG